MSTSFILRPRDTQYVTPPPLPSTARLYIACNIYYVISPLSSGKQDKVQINAIMLPICLFLLIKKVLQSPESEWEFLPEDWGLMFWDNIKVFITFCPLLTDWLFLQKQKHPTFSHKNQFVFHKIQCNLVLLLLSIYRKNYKIQNPSLKTTKVESWIALSGIKASFIL